VELIWKIKELPHAIILGYYRSTNITQRLYPNIKITNIWEK